MRQTLRTALFLLPCLIACLAAQDPAAQAEMFYKHRLAEDAKRTAIQTLFASRAPATQLRCKMLLARIATDEHRVGDALELWQDIAANHKDTGEGKTAALLLAQWATVARSAARPAIDNPLAAAWISAAEFWAGGAQQEPRVDTIGLETEDAAEFWLRKVVAEFPRTEAAAAALAAIARAWIGGEGDAQTPAGGASGLAAAMRAKNARCQPQFEHRIARAERAVGELQAMFPRSPEVPRLQFAIAQVYLRIGDEKRAQPWLLKCADTDGQETFWTHLARLRLQQVRN